MADGMSDIQDEAYTEAMDEIARLKNGILELGHRVKLSEYQKLQALCTRAADVLEHLNTIGRSDQVSELIADLRKAAG
jgi:hypothetical protein